MIKVASSTNWPEKRFKFIAHLRNERIDAASDHADYLGLENIQSWTGTLLPSTTSEISEAGDSALGTANVFRSGDVLFGKLRPYLAKAYHADRDGVCSTELLVLDPQPELHPRYLLYSILSPTFVGLVDASTFGAKMPRANWEFIGSMNLPVPAYETQHLTADYLDRETERIDALAVEKEKMLVLLEEKRTAMIRRAVTRGLNPDVPMKPSGLDWLGEIPAHWEVCTLKRSSSRIDTGSTPAASYMDGTLPSDCIWFTPGDFGKSKLLTDSRRKIPHEAIEDNEAKIFPAFSIMVIGIGATLGKVASSPYDFSANQQINVICPLHDVSSEFLLYVLQDSEIIFRANANSATLPILNQEKLGFIRITLPPLSEQLEIVEELNNKRDSQVMLLEELEHSLGLLKERRAALITAAVTGQILIKEMQV